MRVKIAEMYPAETDTNNTAWYRPAFDGRTPPGMWGWTSQPEQAHESYQVS